MGGGGEGITLNLHKITPDIKRGRVAIFFWRFFYFQELQVFSIVTRFDNLRFLQEIYLFFYNTDMWCEWQWVEWSDFLTTCDRILSLHLKVQKSEREKTSQVWISLDLSRGAINSKCNFKEDDLCRKERVFSLYKHIIQPAIFWEGRKSWTLMAENLLSDWLQQFNFEGRPILVLGPKILIFWPMLLLSSI